MYVDICMYSCVVAKLCVMLCDSMDCSFFCPWNFLGKNTGVGCHFLLQEIFLTQVEPKSPALQVDSLPLSHLGSPYVCIYHNNRNFMSILALYEAKKKKMS